MTVAGRTLLGLGGLLRRAEVSDDGRALYQIGGRDADAFYRDRWSYDKVVRSTHGVNCTGTCSWKVYVKDGIITWEAQQTDYPSVGPDRPEYEPRGCPRGAAFSWYTYSPTRVRYPYARGVLVEMYRRAKAEHGGDPVAAWAAIQTDPESRRHPGADACPGPAVRSVAPFGPLPVSAAHRVARCLNCGVSVRPGRRQPHGTRAGLLGRGRRLGRWTPRAAATHLVRGESGP